MEQLTYIVLRPFKKRNPNLPDNFKNIVTKLVSEPKSLRIKSFDGFSLPTGRIKIISSDKPLLFTE